MRIVSNSRKSVRPLTNVCTPQPSVTPPFASCAWIELQLKMLF